MATKIQQILENYLPTLLNPLQGNLSGGVFNQCRHLSVIFVIKQKNMKHTHTVNYEIIENWSELSDQEQELVVKAQEASANAYAPYSNFFVGASVLLETGIIITGNNQENIAYPSGLCAERVALFYTGANYPGVAVKTLVVVAKGDLVKPDECISPCGSCRQVIAQSEYRQKTPIRLILVAQNGRTFIFDKASDLLVFPFGMEA
jgi:cytidine deaminase